MSHRESQYGPLFATIFIVCIVIAIAFLAVHVLLERVGSEREVQVIEEVVVEGLPEGGQYEVLEQAIQEERSETEIEQLVTSILLTEEASIQLLRDLDVEEF